MMTRNEEYIQKAFVAFYKVADATDNWSDSDLKNNIVELNKKHLLENLDKALVLVTEEDVEGEVNND